jgi:hypothetical protein
MLHAYDPDTRNEVPICRDLINKATSISEKNRKINQMQAVIDRQKRQMADLGIVPCPNNCFEQEPGNGSFEITPGWCVAECPVCHGRGVVNVYTRNIFMGKHGDDPKYDPPRDNFLD